MKKYCILYLLFSFSTAYSQVAIQTENPASGSMLHIDAKENNTTIATDKHLDDVVVDGNGNMGVGTISPQAKLHVETDGVVPPFRIADGTQADTKILGSDANGNVSWVNQPSSGGWIYNITGTSVTSYPYREQFVLASMPVTESGNYLVVIRWWGRTTVVDAVGKTSAYFDIVEATSATATTGTSKDGIEYYLYTQANAPFSFTTSLYGYFEAGKFLNVTILSAIPLTTVVWQIGNSSPTDIRWNPSIVIFRV